MIIGEGTNEIQRLVICRNLLERYGERLGALTSRETEPPERRQMVLAVRQLVDKDVVPVVAEYEAPGRDPAPLVDRLSQLGVLGALVSPPAGGLGLDLVSYAMLVEELARGWTTLAALAAGQAAAGRLVERFGRAPSTARAVPALTRGERWISLACSGAVRARRHPGGWTLAGVAPLVDHADRSDTFLVVAKADGATGLFAVGRDAHRLAVGATADTLGLRGAGAADVVLDGVEVADADALGERAAAEALALARLGVAAAAVGVAQAAFEAALRYSQQRTAFGQPICQHQAIQLKLADMAARITAARLLAYDAAARLGDDAGAHPVDDTAATMAKVDASETAYAVTLEAMRIHGGYGYTREFAVERFYRDAARLLVAVSGNDADRRALARRLAAAAR
jgi:alkylation response protein AidB-like acyl-CoA dehydrogenase